MKALLMLMTVSLGFLAAGAGHAQAPASAPAGSTAQCKDGTWYSGQTKRGACRGHKGIQEWYGAPRAAGAATMPHEETTPAKSRRVSKKEAAGETAPPAAAAAPAGSTALCKDGSYFSGETKRGACRGHKGIKEWYGARGAATAAAPAPASVMPTRAAPPAAAAATPAARASHAAPPASPETRAAAPGGGAGQVWVNSESMVYHCPGDRYYGKTKHGEYMSEAEAKAKGDHAARGKSCSH